MRARGTGAFGRRGLLRGGAAVGVAAVLPFSFTYQRMARAQVYGALVPDPDGILDLPPGFSYKILIRHNDPMSDGYRSPGLPDAMGTFVGDDGSIILMRNHELGVADILNTPLHPGQEPPPEAFNPGVSGGVTRLVIDPVTLEVKSSNLVLFGTLRNCAGGVSPWGWLSCEETIDSKHGYTFLCKPDAERIQPAQQIRGYGRFKHEAACVDPATFIAYLTEDQGDSCLYRFVPTDKADPFTGKLQALRAVDEDRFATSNMEVGQSVKVAWIDVDDPTPVEDTLRGDAQAKGAAIVKRGEGICFWEGAVYVCSTSGGPLGAGQIFRLVDRPDGATLELLARSDDPTVLDHPDNITVAPWGELFMAEDGDNGNYVRGLTAAGEVFDFARNAISKREFAGVCFSRDGQVMFLNLQFDGITFAITGPFPKVQIPEDTSGGTSGTGEADTTGFESGKPAIPTSSGAAKPGGGTGESSESSDGASGGALDDDGGCGCVASERGAAVDVVIGAVAIAALRGRTAGGDQA